MTALVVGVGNRARRDDGVGPVVAERVGAARPDLDVVEVSGDATRMLDLWAGADLVVVVDAVRTGDPVGSCRRWSWREGGWDGAPPPSQVSSHLVGVREAVDLAAALDRLPATLVVVGVEVADLGLGPGLSPLVADAVEDAVALVVATLGTASGVCPGPGGRSPAHPGDVAGPV